MAAKARRDMNWEELEKHLLFPQKAREVRLERAPEANDTCTMCGDFCAMKKGMEVFQKDIAGDKLSTPK